MFIYRQNHLRHLRYCETQQRGKRINNLTVMMFSQVQTESQLGLTIGTD